jgi:tripartite-type tricarboxylate transporter receptor subunit TctC
MMTDLMGGQITSAFVDTTTATPHLKSGKFKVLATAGTQRNRNVPAAPVFQELGYHSFGWYGWVSLFVPAATPAPIVSRISADAARVLRMPDVIARLEGLALAPVGSNPEEFARSLREDANLFEKIIKDAKISLE